MKKNNKLDFLGGPLLYLLIGVLLLRYYQYQINSDGVAYILVAQRYLKGDFLNGVNGYWSPLLSWLLVPFLSLGITPLLACKILLLIIGLFVMIGIRLLSYQFEMAEDIRTTVIISSVLPVLWWAYCLFSPDLLVVMILIYYFIFIFARNYPEKKYNGILCGFLGAVGYLAKAYQLPFFLLHFSLLNLIHYLYSKDKKKNVLKNFLYGLLIFAFLSGIWIVIISRKYNTITFSTAGKHTYRVEVLGSGEPEHTEGFLEPIEGSITIWEDPDYLKFKNNNTGVPKNMVNVVFHNILSVLDAYNGYSFLSIVIITNGFLLILLYFKKFLSEKTILFAVITFLVYPSGYVLLHVEARYIAITEVLIILAGGYLLNLLLRDKFNKISRKVILFFLLLSFCYSPAYMLYNYRDIQKNVCEWSEILRNSYGISGNIASDRGFWWNTLYIAYYLNARHYGEPARKDISFDELKKDFEKFNIDYYFQWDLTDTNMIKELSSHYTEIRDTRLPFFIYKLKKNE